MPWYDHTNHVLNTRGMKYWVEKVEKSMLVINDTRKPKCRDEARNRERHAK